MSTQPTNPFGGGQTGTGGSPINGTPMAAGQFGLGSPLITLGSYFNALQVLAAGPLHIVYIPASFTAVARDQGTLAVDKALSITNIRQFEQLYSFQFSEPGYPPLQDTPPVEIQAGFELDTAPYSQVQSANVAALFADYSNANTYALALAFLTKWFGLTGQVAAQILASKGINPPAA